MPIAHAQTKKATTDNYKAIRSQEICDMAKAAGIGQYCQQIIAHLLRECGNMTEYCSWTPGKKSNDHGWAIGLAQWHIHYRYKDWQVANHYYYPDYSAKYVADMRDKFFSDHPEMRDWRYQANKYVAEMSGCVKDGHGIWTCIKTWNASPSYINDVKGHLAEAAGLLSL